LQPTHGRPHRGRPLIIVLVAAAVTVLLAVPLGVWRTHRPAPKPGTVISAPSLLDSAGDAYVGAGPSPKEPTSREEWTGLLSQLQHAAASGDTTARRRLALALYNLGRLDEAQAIYEDLLRTKDDAAVRNRLGNTLRDRGDLKGAEAAYRLASAKDPTLPAPYVNLAEVLWRTHRDTEAAAVLRHGLGVVAPGARTGLEEALSYLSAGGDTTTPARD
jgi:tetratricopeptide (TPR) repeat protein